MVDLRTVAFLVAWAVAEEVCREMQCKVQDIGVCVRATPTSYNVQSCLGDRGCDFVNMVMPHLSEPQLEVNCTPNYDMPHSVTYKQLLGMLEGVCGMAEYYQSAGRLVSREVPQECNITSDCILTNGSYTPCRCGLDGKRYCVFGEGDDVYLEYSAAACNQSMNEYLRLTNLVFFQAYLLTHPDCANEIFTDFSWSEYLNTGGDVYRLFGHLTFGRYLTVAISALITIYL